MYRGVVENMFAIWLRRRKYLTMTENKMEKKKQRKKVIKKKAKIATFKLNS